MSSRARRSHSWPLLELERVGGQLSTLRAGAVGRGRYVAIDVCGRPLTFRYLERAVTCPHCQRQYAVTKPEG